MDGSERSPCLVMSGAMTATQTSAVPVHGPIRSSTSTSTTATPMTTRVAMLTTSQPRIPRVVVDVCGARPIDLAIIDGIASMGGSEGPWAGGEGCEPKALVAGTNCVNTDAVAAAVMGYDPMASQGTPPFDLSDNHLELAERVGLGTRDPSRIEVAGLSIPEARFDFSPMVRSRYPRAVPPYPSEPD